MTTVTITGMDKFLDLLEKQNNLLAEIDKTLTCIDAELNDLMGDGYTLESICANLQNSGDDDETRD